MVLIRFVVVLLVVAVNKLLCIWKLNTIRKVCSAHFFILYSLAVSRSHTHDNELEEQIHSTNVGQSQIWYANVNYILYIAFACKSITSLLIRIKIGVKKFFDFFSYSHLCSLHSNNKWLIVVYATANKLNQIRGKMKIMCD